MTVLEHAAEVAPLDPDMRRRLEALDTTLLSDAMSGRGTMAAAIGPVAPGLKLVGPARTAASPGAVTAAIWAIARLQAGEVLVIDGGGGGAHASLGGIMALDARNHGAAGCVIDGAVRDSAELRESGFPVFARAAIPHGAGADPDGAIGGAVRAGGVWVHPGDILVGDDDGVVAIPQDELEAVVAAAEAKRAKEADWVAGLKAGKSLAEVHGFAAPKPAAGGGRARQP